MTPSLKLCRPKLEKTYKEQLLQLYEVGKTRHEISSVVSQLLSASEFSTTDTDEETLSQLGVDSMSAIRLQNFVKEKFKIDLPISYMFQEKATISNVAKLIDDLVQNKSPASGKMVEIKSEDDLI